MPGLRRAGGNRLNAAFWAEFRKTHPGPDEIPNTTVFGDSPAQQDELCALILAGQKRATASLAQWYGEGGDKMPEPGDYAIILDGAGIPRGVIQTTEVEILPFNQVQAAFAAEEGEGDGSLAHWQSEHRRFFTAETGIFAEDAQIVCERFHITLAEDMIRQIPLLGHRLRHHRRHDTRIQRLKPRVIDRRV